MSWFDIYLDEKAHENRKSFHEWNEAQDKKNAENDSIMQILLSKVAEKNRQENEEALAAEIKEAKERAEAEIRSSYVEKGKAPDERRNLFEAMLSGLK